MFVTFSRGQGRSHTRRGRERNLTREWPSLFCRSCCCHVFIFIFCFKRTKKQKSKALSEGRTLLCCCARFFECVFIYFFCFISRSPSSIHCDRSIHFRTRTHELITPKMGKSRSAWVGCILRNTFPLLFLHPAPHISVWSINSSGREFFFR